MPRLVNYEIDLRAEMAVVYHHLTDPAALLTWIAVEAVSEAAVGGLDGRCRTARRCRVATSSCGRPIGWSSATAGRVT